MGRHNFNLTGTGSNSIEDGEIQNSVSAGTWGKAIGALLTFIPLQHYCYSPRAAQINCNLKFCSTTQPLFQL